MLPFVLYVEKQSILVCSHSIKKVMMLPHPLVLKIGKMLYHDSRSMKIVKVKKSYYEICSCFKISQCKYFNKQ